MGQIHQRKSDTFDVFKDLCLLIQKEKGKEIIRIRSDHGREFENSKFTKFCTSRGIEQEFLAPITPQQNGIVERKNMTLQECTRAIMHAQNLPYQFWAEAMHTGCHIHNRVTLRSGTKETQYELWKGRKPNVKYFHVFGTKCYIYWLIVSKEENWIPKVMKASLWDIHQTVGFIECTTNVQ
jgi:transposase InsO family protein